VVKAFISYAVENQEIADEVVNDLEARRVPCWISARDLTPPGTPWGAAITREIAECSDLVVLLSSTANHSQYVPRELDYAVSLHKRVYPVKIDATPTADALKVYVSVNQHLVLPHEEPARGEALARLALAILTRGNPNEDQPAGQSPGEPSSYVKDKLRHDLVQINGRRVQTGLTKDDVKRVYSFLAKHTDFGQTWRARWQLKRQLRAMSPPNVVAVKPFQLCTVPVTNALFGLFVRDTGHMTRPEQLEAQETWLTDSKKRGPRHPVTRVSFRDAEAFCKWAGMRLPSTEEFASAVRGIDGLLFPWSNEWKLEHCNDQFWGGDEETTDVDKFPEGISNEGVFDLCGNVFEWVTSALGQKGVQLLAGGAYDVVSVLRGNAATRMRASESGVFPDVGFRYACDMNVGAHY
jgi:formylglycine-generating enzyme required for sulfatase activity